MKKVNLIVTKRVDKLSQLCYTLVVTKVTMGVSNLTIAERLIQARGSISRETVAKAVGVSVSAIAMYENGARVPRDEVKVKLADYYKTSVQFLFFNQNVTLSDLKNDEKKVAMSSISESKPGAERG